MFATGWFFCRDISSPVSIENHHRTKFYSKHPNRIKNALFNMQLLRFSESYSYNTYLLVRFFLFHVFRLFGSDTVLLLLMPLLVFFCLSVSWIKNGIAILKHKTSTKKIRCSACIVYIGKGWFGLAWPGQDITSRRGRCVVSGIVFAILQFLKCISPCYMMRLYIENISRIQSRIAVCVFFLFVIANL